MSETDELLQMAQRFRAYARATTITTYATRMLRVAEDLEALVGRKRMIRLVTCHKIQKATHLVEV